jgi:hypothetical protein
MDVALVRVRHSEISFTAAAITPGVQLDYSPDCGKLDCL